MAALLPLLRRATRTAPAAPDGELLARFADTRDEGAFAELVRRHGPVVYRVCCRLVGPTAAEDAFQAVFLVLATRLSAARTAQSVGGWLVGVAGRVARQMRRAALRRTRHETAAAGARALEEPEPARALSDEGRALDEELAGLPDHLRAPVVLCLLQGRTQEEAAAELGRDARTLRRRLDRAKAVLRARLARRGVVPAVAAALVAGAGEVSAAVPPALAARTVATVFDFLTGGSAAAGSAPAVLAKGVATTMFTRKLKSLLGGAFAGLLGLGAVIAGDGPSAAPPTPVAAPAPMVLPAPATAATVTPPLAPAAPAPAQQFDWKADEDMARRLIGGMFANVPPNERQVFIQAVCLKAAPGFCERIGLTEEDSVSGVWILTPRERRMFTALMRAEKLQGGLEVLSIPQITVLDGQTSHVQIGGEVPVVTGLEAVKQPDGTIVHKATVGTVTVGTKLRVTPKVGASGQVQLKVETENSELVPGPVQIHKMPVVGLPPGVRLAAVQGHATNKQSAQTTVVLPDTGTVVIRASLSAGPGGKPGPELLWVLTPHVIRGEKQPAPVTPPPVTPPPLPRWHVRNSLGERRVCWNRAATVRERFR